jgi:hypothetical protein
LEFLKDKKNMWIVVVVFVVAVGGAAWSVIHALAPQGYEHYKIVQHQQMNGGYSNVDPYPKTPPVIP